MNRRTRVRTIDCPDLNARHIPRTISETIWWDRSEGLTVARVDVETLEIRRFHRLIASVGIVERQGIGGTDRLFVCPLSGKTCRVLYLHDERVGTPAALGIHYASQSRTTARRAALRRDCVMKALDQPGVRIERRRVLVDKLEAAIKQVRWSEDEDPGDQLILEDHRNSLRPTRARQRTTKLAANSTRFAMMEGRRADDTPGSRIARQLSEHRTEISTSS